MLAAKIILSNALYLHTVKSQQMLGIIIVINIKQDSGISRMVEKEVPVFFSSWKHWFNSLSTDENSFLKAPGSKKRGYTISRA